MAHCEGPISIVDDRKRWLCHGAHTTLRMDLYKKMLSFKPWCVEGNIIRGVRTDPVPSACFRSRTDAEAHIQQTQSQISPHLAGMHCKCRRRRRHV